MSPGRPGSDCFGSRPVTGLEPRKLLAKKINFLHFPFAFPGFLHFLSDKIIVFVDNRVDFGYILDMKFILNDYIESI